MFVTELNSSEIKTLLSKMFSCDESEVQITYLKKEPDCVRVSHLTPFDFSEEGLEDSGVVETTTTLRDYTLSHDECAETHSDIQTLRKYLYDKFGVEYLENNLGLQENKTTKFNYKMPIGDWSSDGHGICTYYNIESNLPLEEVREAHFGILEKTGIDVEKLCSSYLDNKLPFKTAKELLELGFNKNLLVDFDEDLYNETLKDGSEKEYNLESPSINPKTVANIWAFLLNKSNPELNLSLVKDPHENITFYGFDKKGRHITSPGYGCSDI